MKLSIFKNEKFGQLRCIEINSEIWFVGKDVIDTLGYKTDEGISYTKYIKRHCLKGQYILYDKNSSFKDYKSFDYRELGQRGGYLVNEPGLYSLTLGSELESAVEFKQWVTEEVLPSIRKNGGYISPNATMQQIEDLSRFSKVKVMTTFAECNPLKLEDTINSLKIHIEDFPTKQKIELYKLAIKGLGINLDTLTSKSSSLCFYVSEQKALLTAVMHELENRRNGGIKASKTKKIAQQDEKIKELSRQLDKFTSQYAICVNYHGFSVNAMYSTLKDGTVVKSDAYNYWIDNFPKKDLEPIDSFNERVDKTKPMKLFLAFEKKKEHDLDNLIKSFQDMLATVYGFDDRLVEAYIIKKMDDVDTYEEGKIYYWIVNDDLYDETEE